MPKGIERTLDESGRVVQRPSRSTDKVLVLQLLISKFDAQAEYSEQTVNELLKSYHDTSRSGHTHTF